MIWTVLAAVLAIAGQPAQLELGAGWQEDGAAMVADGPVLVARSGDGGLLAVTVAMVPNNDAWQKPKRAAYQQAIVDGFAAQPGVTVKKATPTLVKGVPCIDLTLVRDGKPVAVRVLLFRTRTVTAAVEGLGVAAALAAARALVPTQDAEPSR